MRLLCWRWPRSWLLLADRRHLISGWGAYRITIGHYGHGRKFTLGRNPARIQLMSVASSSETPIVRRMIYSIPLSRPTFGWWKPANNPHPEDTHPASPDQTAANQRNNYSQRCDIVLTRFFFLSQLSKIPFAGRADSGIKVAVRKKRNKNKINKKKRQRAAVASRTSISSQDKRLGCTAIIGCHRNGNWNGM